MSTGTSSNRDIPITVRVSLPHPKYYLRGGDLHVIAGNTLFRVHAYFFTRDSALFRTKLNPVSPGQTKEGMTPDSAVVLNGITAEEFEVFLWVFYNPKYSLYEADIDTWKSILNLAKLLKFEEVKALAIRELHMKKVVVGCGKDGSDGSLRIPTRAFLLLFAFSWTVLLFYMIRDFPSNIQIL